MVVEPEEAERLANVAGDGLAVERARGVRARETGAHVGIVIIAKAPRVVEVRGTAIGLRGRVSIVQVRRRLVDAEAVVVHGKCVVDPDDDRLSVARADSQRSSVAGRRVDVRPYRVWFHAVHRRVEVVHHVPFDQLVMFQRLELFPVLVVGAGRFREAVEPRGRRVRSLRRCGAEDRGLYRRRDRERIDERGVRRADQRQVARMRPVGLEAPEPRERKQTAAPRDEPPLQELCPAEPPF